MCLEHVSKKFSPLETVNPLRFIPGFQDLVSGKEILAVVLHKLPQQGSQ